MTRALWTAILVAVLPLALGAQDEDALREAFEGRLVAPRLDMPATTDGVNLYPYRPTPIDGDLHRDVVRHGVGVPAGRAVPVTRIKVKGKHIEFQLGKGGDRQEPTFSKPYVGKSREEKRLEDEIDEVKDRELKRKLEDRLRDVRDRRRREEKRLESLARIEHELAMSQHTPEEWALMAGSRFNLRFDSNVPPEALTPEGLRALLARWVDFEPPPESAAGAPAPGLADLSKGMSEDEVELTFGEPTSCEDSAAEGLSIRSCVWELGEGFLEARFVDGVLVRYTLSSDPR